MTGRLADRTMETNGGSKRNRAPFASPVFLLILIGLEAKALLDFQGRRGIISVVRWNLRLVIFGAEGLST